MEWSHSFRALSGHSSLSVIRNTNVLINPDNRKNIQNELYDSFCQREQKSRTVSRVRSEEDKLSLNAAQSVSHCLCPVLWDSICSLDFCLLSKAHYVMHRRWRKGPPTAVGANPCIPMPLSLFQRYHKLQSPKVTEACSSCKAGFSNFLERFDRKNLGQCQPHARLRLKALQTHRAIRLVQEIFQCIWRLGECFGEQPGNGWYK